MTKRKAIPARMKIDCLLYRENPTCAICDTRIFAEDEIEWDHIHALVHGGADHYTNIRPLHAECHKIKTKADIQANAKVKRIIADKPSRHPMKSSGRKIPSRPWSKRA